MFAENWMDEHLAHAETVAVEDAFQRDDDPFCEDEPAPRTTQARFTFEFGIDVEPYFNKAYKRFAVTCGKFGQPLSILSREVIEKPHPWIDDETIKRVRVVVSIPPIAGEKGRVLGRFERSEDGKDFYTEVVDEAYRNEVEALKPRAGECDHCSVKQRRNQTFVCETSEGIKIVGRSCLRDFVGLDPAKTLAFWNGLNGFTPETIDYFGGAPLLAVDEVVKAAFRVARKLGGYDRERSQRHAWLLLMGSRATGETGVEERAIIKSYAGFDPPFDREAFTAYIRSLRNDSFSNDLRVALNQQCVKSKRLGLLVAGVGLSVGRVLKQAETADLKAAEAARPPAKHLPADKGERVDFVGEVVRTFPYQGQFGDGVGIVIRCDDGSSLLHWSTAMAKPEAGKRFNIRATVKEHGKDRRSGEPVTTITRATYEVVDAKQPQLL